MSGSDWDARYRGAAGGLFGEAPCAWLPMLCARPGFAPRSALLPADGDGRNGAWLAARGVAVTAVDLSAEATRRAEARDAALGARAERIVADLADWRPDPGSRWECCLIFFLHGPSALRRAVIAMGAGALAPGGWLALEGFAAGGQCGPTEPDKLYDPVDIARAAESAGLTVHEAMVGEALLDDGPRHRGMARVVRLLARAPG